MQRKKPINERVGENIQAARNQAGYTQEKLSEIVGITPNHLSAIERGVSGATLELIEKLCLLFSVSADFLIFNGIKEDDFASELATQFSRIKPEYRPQVKRVLMALLEIITMQDTEHKS